MTPDMKHLILQTIPEGSTVLDLGCGDGSLLLQLCQQKKCHGYGVELKTEHVLSCTEKGVPVYHGDINDGLPEFSDQSFDFVVLSQTLQVVKNPILLLKEMVRVGRQTLVIFPNFAYFKNRIKLLSGTAPKSKNLPHEWYDTPNIRVITISDFKRATDKNDIEIYKDLSTCVYQGFSGYFAPLSHNLFLKHGIFLLKAKDREEI